MADFDIYDSDPLGDYRESDKPILQWDERQQGWLLTERAATPRDHFIPGAKDDLYGAMAEADDMLALWADDDATDRVWCNLCDEPVQWAVVMPNGQRDFYCNDHKWVADGRADGVVMLADAVDPN